MGISLEFWNVLVAAGFRLQALMTFNFVSHAEELEFEGGAPIQKGIELASINGRRGFLLRLPVNLACHESSVGQSFCSWCSLA